MNNVTLPYVVNSIMTSPDKDKLQLDKPTNSEYCLYTLAETAVNLSIQPISPSVIPKNIITPCLDEPNLIKTSFEKGHYSTEILKKIKKSNSSQTNDLSSFDGNINLVASKLIKKLKNKELIIENGSVLLKKLLKQSGITNNKVSRKYILDKYGVKTHRDLLTKFYNFTKR